MHCAPTSAVALLDLRPTAEPVGKHDVSGLGVAQSGEQDPFGRRDRDVVVRGLESEVARQPAAARIQDDGVDTSPAQQRGIGIERHDRVLVAVHLHQCPTIDVRWVPSG